MPTDTPETLRTRRHNDIRHVLDAKSRPLCKARVSLSEDIEVLTIEQPAHPGHPEHDPVTKPTLCIRCAAALRPIEPIDTAQEVVVDPREALRAAVQFAYSLQKTRIQQGNRAGPQAAGAETMLGTEQRTFMAYASNGLEVLEESAFKEVDRLAKDWNIYPWLRAQKGCGPTMTGVLIAYINPHKAPTVSSLWKWCGLDVVDGHAARREKGKKTTYDPWLKSKVIAVLGASFIKANSPWRKFYDDYKQRKQHQIVPVCMLCHGAGVYADEPCSNCKGVVNAAPWGKSDAHRHEASVRYMVKMFLAEFWKQWRTLEGLDVRVPYMEEYLNRKHHEKPTQGLLTSPEEDDPR